jgi:hypothetical protein
MVSRIAIVAIIVSRLRGIFFVFFSSLLYCVVCNHPVEIENKFCFSVHLLLETLAIHRDTMLIKSSIGACKTGKCMSKSMLQSLPETSPMGLAPTDLCQEE